MDQADSPNRGEALISTVMVLADLDCLSDDDIIIFTVW
jgi:hypothetical protein